MADNLEDTVRDKVFAKDAEIIKIINLKTDEEELIQGIFKADDRRKELMAADPHGVYLFSKKCPHPERCSLGNQEWHESVLVALGKTFIDEGSATKLIIRKLFGV